MAINPSLKVATFAAKPVDTISKATSTDVEVDVLYVERSQMAADSSTDPTERSRHTPWAALTRWECCRVDFSF